MTKVQAFYCDIILLSLPCYSHTAWLEDLPWLTELSRCLQANILFIISIEDVKEVVVGTCHYGPKKEVIEEIRYFAPNVFKVTQSLYYSLQWRKKDLVSVLY